MLCRDTAKGSAKMACSSSTASGTAVQHRRVGGHELGVAARRVGGDAGVQAGADVAVGEAPAQAVVAGLTGRADRVDAAGGAGQPRVEHDPLADLEPGGLGAERHDLGHHLVAEHLRERAQAAHRAVAVAVEVEQDLLGVRAADAGEPRAHDQPVRPQRSGVGHLEQRARRGRQVLRQRVGTGRGRPRLRAGAEHERLHPGFPHIATGRRTDRPRLTVVSGSGGGSGGVTVGIDIGTTSVKAVAADADGNVLARARIPHEVRAPEPGSFEHDPDQAWRADVLAALAQVAAGLDVAGGRRVGHGAVAGRGATPTARRSARACSTATAGARARSGRATAIRRRPATAAS